MVRLSKPGTQLQPVSYLHEIDDENVLQALQKLKRRAIGVAANPQPAARTPTSTPREWKTDTCAPLTSNAIDGSTPPSSKICDAFNTTGSLQSSPKLPSSDQEPCREFTAPSPQVEPSSPPSIRNVAAASKAMDKFIPLWKVDPSLEPPPVPRWQIETAAALERAIQKQTGANTGRYLPRSSSTIDDRPEVIEKDLISHVGADHRGTHRKGMNTSRNSRETQRKVRSPLSVRTSAEKTPYLSIDRLLAKSEKLSTILNKFGCFGVMDEICEPTAEFDDDFTYSSDTYMTETESSISWGKRSANLDVTETRYVASLGTSTSTSRSRDGAIARRGVGDLDPMLTLLESFRDFLALGKSEKSHLRYISKLLYRMEDRLQDFSGHRRKIHSSRRKRKANLYTVSQQIDEVNKLILRVVEDFIDEQVLKVTALDDEEYSLLFKENDNDLTTVGDENSTFQDEPLKEFDSLAIPPGISFDRDYRPPSVGGSLAQHRVTLSPREATGRDDTVSSTDENDDHRSLGSVSDSLSKASTGSSNHRDDKSQRSSKSNTSRTTALMKNISKVLAWSPKNPSKRKQYASPSPSRTTYQGITSLDGALFVPAQEEHKQGLPPLQPRTPRGRDRIARGIDDTDVDCEGKLPAVSRSFSAGRKLFKRQGSERSDSNGSFRSVVRGKGATAQSPKSVASLVDPMDDQSV